MLRAQTADDGKLWNDCLTLEEENSASDSMRREVLRACRNESLSRNFPHRSVQQTAGGTRASSGCRGNWTWG